MYRFTHLNMNEIVKFSYANPAAGSRTRPLAAILSQESHSNRPALATAFVLVDESVNLSENTRVLRSKKRTLYILSSN